MSVGIALATPAVAQSPKVIWTDEWAKNHAREQLAFYGWHHASQWSCLSTLWGKESGWRLSAKNKTPVKVKKNGKWVKVHAGGIPQILGMSPTTPAPEQIRRGLVYIQSRYQSPCKALNWWSRHFWY